MPAPSEPARGTGRRASRGAFVFAVIAFLIAAGAVTMAFLPSNQPPVITAEDLRGNTVQLESGPTPPPAEVVAATPDDGGRLIVSSVGLNVPLGSMNEADGVIVPPGFTSAYWVRNRGVATAEATAGTVYVVMHALRGGAVGPGNYITDVENQRSKLAAGDTIDVDGTRYTVDESQLISKSELPHVSEVWSDTPGRLVLITCLQHADGSPSTQNLVVTATL